MNNFILLRITWGFPRPKTAKMGTVEGGVFMRGVQLERHNFGRWESFLGLADIPKMCLLYVILGGRRTVWAL